MTSEPVVNDVHDVIEDVDDVMDVKLVKMALVADDEYVESRDENRMHVHFVHKHWIPILEVANDFDVHRLPKVHYVILAYVVLVRAEQLKLKQNVYLNKNFQFKMCVSVCG